MKWRTSFLSFVIAISLISIFPISAQAGGGCVTSSPRITNDFVKPGQSFDVTTEYVMYDVSQSLYEDPNYVPYVSFSSSIAWLSKSSEFLGATEQGAKYKATFQVPLDFKGNMQLQAIVFNICGSSRDSGTFGPRVIIQSDESIPTCRIESVKVSDYSVGVGEEFKVAFSVYSDIPVIQPYVELTEFNQVTRFPARLAGSITSNSLRVFEATVSYKQAHQYPYGAIARPEVKNLCNASGEREVIGIMGYITSMAMIKEIIKGAECYSGTQPVSSLNYMGVNEALVCTNYPVGSNRHSWRAAVDVAAEKAAIDKVATDLKAKQEADAKAAIDNAAAKLKSKQEAEAKVATELKAKQEAEAKAAADLKAKQEAEAKAAADKLLSDAKAEAARILSDAKAMAEATTKKTTITCVKGKLTKKVTAIKPICPKGYKKK